MTDLVGRRRELRALADAMSGQGPPFVVLVTGDAGIGKSRLVTEAASVASARGALVLYGSCLPLTQQIPLLPVAEALRGLGAPPNRTIVDAAVSDLPGPSVAALAAIVPALVSRSTERATGSTDQAVVLTGIRDLLTAVEARRHVSLVVEDLHWVDDSTLDLLTFITRSACSPVTVVLTCRSDEPDGQDRLREWLAATARLPTSLGLPLQPFGDAEVAQLVDQLVGQQPMDERFVAAVRRRAEGNPLFTEQVVFESLAVAPPLVGAERVPDSVVALLGARLASVPQDSREVLEVLAVAQRPLDDDTIAQALGVSAVDLGGSLRDLTGRRLILRTPDDAYRLRHALLGEVICSTLLPTELRQRHADVAGSLAATGSVGPGEIAAHWAAARHAAEELRWSVEAAKAAEQVFAWSDAARLWGRVDELWDAVAEADLPPQPRGELVVRRITALWSAGREYVGAAAAADAIESGRYSDDPWTWGRLIYYRDFLAADLDESIAALRRADRALATLPPSESHALVLAQLGRRLDDRREPAAALESFEQSLAVAVAARAEGQGRLMRGVLAMRAYRDGGTYEHLVGTLEGLLAEASDEGQGDVLMRLGVYLTDAMLRAGENLSAAARGRSLLDDARSLGVGQVWAAGMVLGNTLEADLNLGRTAEARRLLDTYRTGILEGSPLYPHQVNEAQLLVPEGRLVEAKAILEAVVDEVIPGSDRELTWCWLTLDAGFWSGDDPAALRDTGLTAVQSLLAGPGGEQMGGLLWYVARAAAESRTADRVAELRTVLARSDALEARPGRGLARGHAASVQAELGRLEAEPTLQLWAEAAETWRDLGCPHHEGYCRWRLADELLGQRRRKDAGCELRRAADLSTEHVPQHAQIAALARRAGLDLFPEPPRTAGNYDAPYGLTARELDVLRLLTSGRTNSQIGSQLFISPKTASVHVSSILRKLQVEGRVQAAALAEREGIVPMPRPR